MNVNFRNKSLHEKTLVGLKLRNCWPHCVDQIHQIRQRLTEFFEQECHLHYVEPYCLEEIGYSIDCDKLSFDFIKSCVLSHLFGEKIEVLVSMNIFFFDM